MSHDDRPAAWVCAPGLWRIPTLAAFLPEYRLQRLPSPATRAVVGWGRAWTSAAGRAFAHRFALPYLALEDGLLRSVGLGEAGAVPLSLLVDDLGVHHDARGPSRLESLIRDPEPWFDDAMAARIATLLDMIRAHGLTKTGPMPAPQATLALPAHGPRILVVDQTAGDASIAGGLADADSFRRMLDAARQAASGGHLLVKRHPATVAGLKPGCLPPDLGREAVLAGDMDTDTLLRQVDAVFTVSSGLGFEALVRGVPVHCFGLPFYAGWGLTMDAQTSPRRGVERPLEVVAAAALIAAARHADPVTGQACTAEQAAQRLVRFRRRARRLAGHSALVGFAPAKRAMTRRLLNAPGHRLAFFQAPAKAVRHAAEHGGRVIVWAGKEPDGLAALARAQGVPLWRMEDGFLRSRGLGSDFRPALSAVLDTQGIYFDGTTVSDLETALATARPDQAERARAHALRQALIETRLSKYNLGGDSRAPDWPKHRPRILVVGQVENDRSILLGCATLRTNAGLLKAVRARHPEAFLIWRDHPDTRAGHRPGRLDAETASLADTRADGMDIATVLDACDAVATLTSLTGFEALLRGKRVITLGRPFYAGWGLTEDELDFPRRMRHLDLDTLVAEALIRHPLYVTPSGLPCEAEDMVALLSCTAPAPVATGGLRRWLRGLTHSLDRRPPRAY